MPSSSTIAKTDAEGESPGSEKRAQHLQQELFTSCCLSASWDKQNMKQHLGHGGLDLRSAYSGPSSIGDQPLKSQPLVPVLV